MPYVKRDTAGRIVAVSQVADEAHPEQVSDDDPALAVFLRGMSAGAEFVESDLDFVRVFEDVLELLLARGVIRFTDLPGAAQAKMIRRRSMRAAPGSLDLLDSDDLV
jgi:hypothetical protein